MDRPVVGEGIDRVDARVKVSGRATYPTDADLPGLAHAVLVQSTVAAGRLTAVDTTAATAAPGVLAVLTHENAPPLREARDRLGPLPPPPLQSDRIVHHGENVAVVVAETFEQATEAARLVTARYAPSPPVVDIDDPGAEHVRDPFGSDGGTGDVGAALATAPVRVERTYRTAVNTNHPMGPFATVASWEGDKLTVHDSTQGPSNTRIGLAGTLGVPQDDVRVLAPYIGGGFGSGLRTWPHTVLATVAARHVGRPVKLVLTRKQMFTSVGHRPDTRQTVRIGATRDGRITAIDHEAWQTVSIRDVNPEHVTRASLSGYASPNISARDVQVRVNVPSPGSMRAPGDAQGNFALESALDELAYELDLDPLELRLRNYADRHPVTGQQWSSNDLRACYRTGAERFGWSRRDPRPRSMRRGRHLVGYGMAGTSFFFAQFACAARVTVTRDGGAVVASAGMDLGTGTYTVMTQLAAELLGLPVRRVRMVMGDSSLPEAPVAGGSGLTGSMGSAIHAAARNTVRAFLDLVRDDAGSPLRGAAVDDVRVEHGRIVRVDDGRGESYAEILTRHRQDELTAEGSAEAPSEDEPVVPTGPYAAKFAEVHVDADLGVIRVARLVTAAHCGRVLNEKTARGQLVGGTVGGIGMALLEHTVTEPRTGRIANGTFGDYLIAVNADIPDLEVHFVGGPDPTTPNGTKGCGELGIPGTAAAIANAVFHATGTRVRRLPITIEQVL
ncbi:xanthine dehydrogenase family protein molybdopterin-binding subunit [Streptomyces griseocarneus]|uniref:xanthine dehydrogenase family protein molybdopterin-binding subunit n=1 Tax=Streptomyces griseocarneus TaxID=51201 RepID=UPI00167D0955|nr:xanthine dehydrogenase family protein molybdopterin-binding subunit [Streptomyces griseocarneus]MBZ6474121.1 xanthine dehydrogenase family protein molybdopterin-binding subunit [Streptomyces griseocarneus]GHG52205.1 acylaldehyde oxidase [Streptomyces griseocarneus]